MMKRCAPPDLGALRNSYHYDVITGHFLHLKKAGGKMIGSVAGHTHKNGYVYICIKGRQYLAHRVAWFFVYGVWVPELAHRDLVKSNNSISNLRISSRGQNIHHRIVRKKSGLPTGVYHVAKRKEYMALITVNKVRHFLGYFKDVDNAAAAYNRAAHLHFGEFALGVTR